MLPAFAFISSLLKVVVVLRLLAVRFVFATYDCSRVEDILPKICCI
jgi:hypothetical protein